MSNWLDGATAVLCMGIAIAITFFGFKPSADFVAFTAFLALARVCGDKVFSE